MAEPRLLTTQMNEVRVVREIRYARGWTREAFTVIVGVGTVLLVSAAALFVTAKQADHETRAAAGMLVAGAVVTCGPALWVLRQRRTGLYARLDEQGIVWGSDRLRDPSLPWSAIRKIRIVPSPARLSDDRTFLFEPVPDWEAPPLPGWWTRLRMRFNEVDTGTPYVLATNRTDCPWRELFDILTRQIPGVPILEGSLRDPP